METQNLVSSWWLKKVLNMELGPFGFSTASVASSSSPSPSFTSSSSSSSSSET